MVDAIDDRSLQTVLTYKYNLMPEKRFSIPIFNVDGKRLGTLTCVDRGLASNMKVISDLTAWRQLYMHYFLTQFEATIHRTKSWLENVVIPSPDRLFFIIHLITGDAIGNFGICKMTTSSGELDNLIRGRKGGDPKLIYHSEIALLSWMFGRLGLHESKLHVFSTNQQTIKLHSAVGFSVLDAVKLTRRNLPDMTEYLLNSNEGEPVDFKYLEMGISRDAFLALHPWVHEIYSDHWQ